MGVVCSGQDSFTFPTLADDGAIEVWDGEVTVDVNTAGVPSGVYNEIEVTAIWDGSDDFPDFSRCSVMVGSDPVPVQLGDMFDEPNTITPVGSLYEITFTGNISYEPGVDDNLELVLEQDNGIQGMNVTAYWSDIEVTIFEEPDCFTPTFSTSESSVFNITTNTANLSWINQQDEEEVSYFEWVIMPTGDAPDTSTAVATNTISNSTETYVTGLSENTDYDAYVRANCGSNGFSEWSEAESFTTEEPPCSLVSAPLIDNFDTSDYDADNNLVDDCWSLTNDGSSFNWEVESSTTATPNTGPDADVSGSGNYLYAKASGANTGDRAFVNLPRIDLSTLTAPSLSFYYHMYGCGIGTLSLEVKDASDTNYTEVFSISGQQQYDETDSFHKQFIDLSAFDGQTVDIRFKAEHAGNFGDIAIDEIIIDEASCPEPALVSFSKTDVTSESVELTWSADQLENIADGYELLVFEADDDPEIDPVESTETINDATITSATIAGLNENTSYDAYIKTLCNTSNESELTGPINFNTKCNSVETAPYNENFDEGNWTANQSGAFVIDQDQLENCWFRSPENNNDNFTWAVITGGTFSSSTGPQDDVSGGGNYVYTEANNGFGSSCFEDETYLNLPSIDLGELSSPYISFYYHMFGSDIGTLSVEIKNNTDTNFTEVFSISGEQQTDSSDEFVEEIVDLSLYAGQIVDIRFKATNAEGDKNDIAIDEITITDPPPTNDDACDAIALTVNESSDGDAYTTLEATEQNGEPDTDLSFGVNASVWFSFEAPPYGNVEIDTAIEGGTLSGSEIAVYEVEECDDFTTYSQVGIAGGFDLETNAQLNLFDLNEGETYYVQVDRHGLVSDGTFGIEVNDLTITYNETNGYQPSNPSGETLFDKVLAVENGTATISESTNLRNVIVEPVGVLKLEADLFSGVLFKSNSTNSGQILSSGNNSIFGAVTVERFIPAGDNNRRVFRFVTTSVQASDGSIRTFWQENAEDKNDNPNPGYGTHITGSTTDGENGFDGTLTGNPSLLIFDNSSQTWSPIDNTDSNSLAPGQPYNLFIRGDRSIDLDSNSQEPTNTRLRATGQMILNDFDFSSALATGDGEFSMIGNPYQAIVDFNSIDFGGDINSNNLYLWNPNAATSGAYEVIDSATPLNQMIQPGQSFFVQNSTTVNTPPELVFTESAKNTSGLVTDVFSNNNNLAIANLHLYNNEDVKMDVIKFRFESGANNGIDDFDAGKLFNPTENIASLNNNTLLSVERRSIPQNEDIIPLFINQYHTEQYEFKIDFSNFNDNLEIYIIDDYLDSETLIDTSQTYNFNVDENIPESIANERFALKIVNTSLHTDANNTNQNLTIYPNPTKKALFFINTSDFFEKDIDIKIVNMLGQKLFEETIDIKSSEIEVDAGELPSGVYIVKLEQEDNTYVSKLIIE